MASSINASTSGGGGIITTADATGNLNLQSGGSTVVAVTSTGATVTGTLAVSGGVTLTTTLPVLQGGTGVTTSTGTGAGVHAATPVFTTTIGVGAATASASGSGITFPATQSASSDANTLDDYEEGTWTPTLTASITNPTATYSSQAGRYTRIGRLVSIQCYIETVSRTGGSGQANIGGLPFTVTGNSTGYCAVPAGQSSGLTGSSPSGIRTNPNTVYLNVMINAGSAALDISSWTAGGYFLVTLSYTTD